MSIAKPWHISVAMATYNGDKFLQTQLDSLAAQTHLPDELVVCDDNSSDQTLDILKRFADVVPFEVKIISNSKNLGFVATFQQAILYTKGDLVFLCDQDDFWFPEKIKQTLAFARDKPTAMLFMNDAELVDGNLNPSGFTTFGQMRAVKQNPLDLVLGCCMAVRRELITLFSPIPSGFPAHDVWIQEFATYLDSKMLIPQVFQYYRRHHKNETAHIVYSLKKINWIAYQIDFYKKLFFSKKKESLAMRISAIYMRIEGLENAILKARIGEKSQFETAKALYLNQLSKLKIRHELTEKGWAERMLISTRLLFSGQYPSGLKSYARDILGRS